MYTHMLYGTMALIFVKCHHRYATVELTVGVVNKTVIRYYIL